MATREKQEGLSEIKILAVPEQTEISDAVQAKLAESGVVILRSPNPELIRLVTPSSGIDVLPANDFVWAALDALAETSGNGRYSEPDADKLRRKFVGNLAKTVRRPLIGWSAAAVDLPSICPEENSDAASDSK